MPKPPERRLTMADLMILVAATAIGIALTRSVVAAIYTEADRADSYLSVGWYKIYWRTVSGTGLSVATVTILVLRLRSPRPSLRRLARQPGAMACAAATLNMVIGLFAAGVFAVLVSVPRLPVGGFFWTILRLHSFPYFIPYSGQAVAGAWLVLIVGRTWRAEPSWIDRAGRLLGACWLVLYFIESYLEID